jgi:ribosome-binding factor A
MGLRQERLADQIRDTLGSCFGGGQMSDPRLAQVTITAVKLTGDLQIAKVYFRVYSGDEAEIAQARKGLGSAAGFLRRKLAEALDVRRVPALQFFFDESVGYGSHIEGLLAGLRAESADT